MPFETADLCGPSVDVPERVETGRFLLRPLTVDDAEMDYEAVTNSRERGLADPIEHRVRTWIDEDWPFDAVAYPGRDIPWAEWTAATGED
ncbi:MAG: hypothetical protein V5A44_03065 [Haloarculaceae archaeon]